MRTDTPAFAEKNRAKSKEPRYTIEQAFDSGNTVLRYLTSHTDAATPGGATVISRVIEGLSGTGQTLDPDKANAAIGAIKFRAVDKGGAITTLLAAQLAAGRSVRRQRTRVYKGFKGLAWSDYTLVQTQLVDKDVTVDGGSYAFSCADIQRELRKDIFDLAKTNLTQSLLKGATTINVVATSAFSTVEHGASYSDAPNQTVGYVWVEDEAIRYTGKTSTTFTGCTRGVLNTREVDHLVDASAAVERRTEVREDAYLEAPALKVIYALLNGRILGTDNLLLRSEEFDKAAWSNTNVTVTADNTVAPDGRTTADKIAATASAVTLMFQAATVAATAATFSVYIKKGSGATDANNYILRNDTTATTLVGVSVNFDTGVLTYTVGSSGAALYPDLNGWYRLVLQASSGISSGNSLLCYVAFTAASETAGEYSYAWGAMLNAVSDELLPYAKTTTAARAQASLPTAWHLGVAKEYLRLAEFLDKRDLYEPLDDELGFVVRGEDLDKTDGKKLIEEQLAFLVGVFLPVHNDGALGCRRMANVLSGAAYVTMLDETNVVSHSPLTHDYAALRNVFDIAWNWEPIEGAYKRRHILRDEVSRALYKDGEPWLREFRFLHGSIHTQAMLQARFDSVRDRYSGPPLRLTVRVVPSLNTLEVGDVVRVRLPNVRDYTMPGGGGPIDRSFEIQNVQIDWITGEVVLKLMGSSRRPGEISSTADATVLTDAWYTGTGTQLSTVLTISANHVTANGSLTGAADLTSAPAIYYHNGDLTIDAGVTVSISANVWIRVKGFFTNNGTITGKGAGHIGAAATGTPTSKDHFNAGTVGFLGAIEAGGGFATLRGKAGVQATKAPPLLGTNATVPYFPMLWDGTTLYGVPQDLRGTSGSSGMPGYSVFFFGASGIIGGAGGNGGAGLAITCRGFAQGAAGKIDLSGNDGASGSSQTIGGVKIYAGSGAGGAPGGLFIMLDGAGVSATDIDDNSFIAKNGKTPVNGQPIEEIVLSGGALNTPHGTYQSIYVGTGDDVVFPLPNLSGARGGSRVQYVPANTTPIEDLPLGDVILHEFIASNWTERTNPKAFEITSIAWNGSIFVAVGVADGTNAYIITSSDGIFWTERANPKNFDLYSVTWGNGLFVAVGAADGTDSYILTSPDGTTWTERAPTVAKNVILFGITWNGSIFVAVGAADGTDAYILTSSDGTTWTERANPKNVTLRSVTWSGSLFVAVGHGDGVDAYIVTSPDGTTWTERSNASNTALHAVLWVPVLKLFVAGGATIATSAYFLTSPDGITWTNRTGNVPAPGINGFAWSGRILVAVCTITAPETQAALSSSRDGVVWTKREAPAVAVLSGIAWSGKRFVVGGDADATDARIYTSMAAS